MDVIIWYARTKAVRLTSAGSVLDHGSLMDHHGNAVFLVLILHTHIHMQVETVYKGLGSFKKGATIQNVI